MKHLMTAGAECPHLGRPGIEACVHILKRLLGTYFALSVAGYELRDSRFRNDLQAERFHEDNYQIRQRMRVKLKPEMKSHAPEPSSSGRNPASRTLRRLVSRPIAPSESASRN
jgi:hypothetical protein